MWTWGKGAILNLPKDRSLFPIIEGLLLIRYFAFFVSLYLKLKFSKNICVVSEWHHSTGRDFSLEKIKLTQVVYLEEGY